jgi:hypothetical protein
MANNDASGTPSYRNGLVRLYGKMLGNSSARVILAEQSLPDVLPGGNAGAQAAVIVQWSGAFFDAFECEVSTVTINSGPRVALPRTEWTLRSAPRPGPYQMCGTTRVVTGLVAVLGPITEIVPPNPSRRRITLVPSTQMYRDSIAAPNGILEARLRVGDRGSDNYPIMAALSAPGTPGLVFTTTEAIWGRPITLSTAFELAYVEETA